MKMTPQHQDNILLRDILERNYYKSFKKGNNNCKNFNLSFFYVNDYTNFKFIPGYESLEEKNDLSKILSNWSLFLDWYSANEFYTNLEIHDDILLNNSDFLEKILLVLEQKKIDYKSLIVYVNVDIINDLKSLELLRKNTKTQFVFNTKINLFSKLVSELKVTANPSEIINILIPPGLTSKQLIQYQQEIFQSDLNVNRYIEVDSINWTNEWIDEYLDYIRFWMNFLQTPEDLFKSNSPINITDQHNIDNENCKTNCSLQNSLSILIVNLSINMCHKFQYDDQVIGYLIPDETEILTIESKILPISMITTHLKRTSTPHCETCSFIGVCKGFCFVNSYNRCFNPVIPLKESCDLKKAKFTLIFNTLSHSDIFVSYLMNSTEFSDLYKDYVCRILDAVKER